MATLYNINSDAFFDTLLKELEFEEGFRTQIYDDATGQPVSINPLFKGSPTWGIGWNLRFGITVDEARLFCKHRCKKNYEYLAKRAWFVNLHDTAQRVFTHLAYQMGAAGCRRFCEEQLLDPLQRRNWRRVANLLETSSYGMAFRARAKRLADLLRGIPDA